MRRKVEENEMKPKEHEKSSSNKAKCDGDSKKTTQMQKVNTQAAAALKHTRQQMRRKVKRTELK